MIQNSLSIQEIKNYIGERQIITSVSGGKDSTAMALWLKENGFDYQAVFIDTGWEHNSTLEYLHEYLPKFIGEVHTVKGPGMMDLVKGKERFPSPNVRFCTGELKIRPMKRYLRSLPTDIVNAVGIRAQESAKRANDPEWEENPSLHCETWRPIIHWTEKDVIAMHHKHNVLPNPLYLKGAERVGCWPCIFARKREIRMLSRLSPDRIAEIRELERHVNIRRQQKDPNAKPMTWFQRGGYSMPIDHVVKWAHNKENEHELFEVQDHQAGCMRWGLCDVAHPNMPQKPE